jgi:hypothetical protein
MKPEIENYIPCGKHMCKRDEDCEQCSCTGAICLCKPTRFIPNEDVWYEIRFYSDKKGRKRASWFFYHDEDEIQKELSYLLKYYNLSEFDTAETLEKAKDYMLKRDIHKSMRNTLRHFVLVDFYTLEILQIDNPFLGGGLSVHIQKTNGGESYCNQRTNFVLSFHKNATVQGWLETDKNGEGTFSLFSVCLKCIKSYLRNGRKN